MKSALRAEAQEFHPNTTGAVAEAHDEEDGASQQQEQEDEVETPEQHVGIPYTLSEEQSPESASSDQEEEPDHPAARNFQSKKAKNDVHLS